MKNLKCISFLLFLLILLSTPLVGCNDQTLTEVNVAEVTHSIFYAPQYAAITEGFFEEEGLSINLINTKGADKTMAALLSDQVDIGFMGPEASIYVFNQGKEDYAVNFAQLTQKDGSFLLAKNPMPNFKFDDLKDKTIIAGRKGGMPEMTLEYALTKNNIDPRKDVTLRTDIQFSVMAEAFIRGEGDFVALFEPVASKLEKEGKGYIIESVGKSAGYLPYTCYSAKKSFIENNPDVLQKFTNAIYKGMKWAESHTAEEIAESIKSQFPDTDVTLLASAIQRYKDQDTWKPDLVLTEEGLNRTMDIMKHAGELEKRAPYDKIVTTQFAEKVMESSK